MHLKKEPKVVIVITGYNSAKFLKDCFTSLKKSTYVPHRIIFVDNNSSDNSVEIAQRYLPEALIIANKSNDGFAGGNNRGMRAAMRLGADYVFLLNPDTILKEDTLSQLMAAANPKVILQPLILLYTNRKTKAINTTGNALTFLGVSYCNNYKQHLRLLKNREIPSASGAGMLLPKQIIRRIGYLDERFFMYHEDLDFCWRARKAGYSIELVSSSYLWHKYTFSRNRRKMFFVERNRLLFLLKNFDTKTLFLIFPSILMNELLVCAFCLKEGYIIEKLQSYGSFLVLAPYYIRERLKKRTSQVTKRDRDLLRFIQPTIEFSEFSLPFIKLYNRILEAYWRAISPLV